MTHIDDNMRQGQKDNKIWSRETIEVKILLQSREKRLQKKEVVDSKYRVLDIGVKRRCLTGRT